MANKQRLVGGALAVLAIAVVPLSLTGPPILRAVVIGVFLLSGPGTSLVLLLSTIMSSRQFSYQLVPLLGSIAIAFSLAISAAVATLMLYAHLWHPSAAIASLALLTLGLLLWNVALRALRLRTGAARRKLL